MGGWECVWICLIGFFLFLDYITIKDVYGKIMCFRSFLFPQQVSVCVFICAGRFPRSNPPHDLHTSQTLSCGSLFDVFCLPQLILRSEEKNRLSKILPHSPLFSPSLCVTGELFFTVCEMTHFYFTVPNKRPHHNAPASASHLHSYCSHISPR